MSENNFDFGKVEMLDHTRLKLHDPDWWKSEEYKMVERIFEEDKNGKNNGNLWTL